jgi:hypothetical protein
MNRGSKVVHVRDTHEQGFKSGACSGHSGTLCDIDRGAMHIVEHHSDLFSWKKNMLKSQKYIFVHSICRA